MAAALVSPRSERYWSVRRVKVRGRTALCLQIGFFKISLTLEKSTIYRLSAACLVTLGARKRTRNENRMSVRFKLHRRMQLGSGPRDDRSLDQLLVSMSTE